MNTEYQTKDLGESAALFSCNCRLIRINRQGPVCWFVFEDEVQCKKLSEEYFYGQLMVKARNYYHAQTILKNRIFSEY